MDKPKLCCHPNCFECPYDDCKNENLYDSDFSTDKQAGVVKYKENTYYGENREERLKKAKEYYYRNRERILAQKKKYRDANLELVRQRERDYYELNKEHIRLQKKESCKKYYEKNKEKIKEKRILNRV